MSKDDMLDKILETFYDSAFTETEQNSTLHISLINAKQAILKNYRHIDDIKRLYGKLYELLGEDDSMDIVAKELDKLLDGQALNIGVQDE